MASNSLPFYRRWSAQQRQRVTFLALIVIEILLLALVGTRLVQVQVVEDYREVVGDQETIYFRNEVVGDPVLFVLIVFGMVLPLISGRLRREIVMLMAMQATIVGLTMFVLWPLVQVFMEGFKAEYGTESFSLVQFEKLFQPMVIRAIRNTMTIGVISAFLSMLIGTLAAYTLTLTDVPWKRWLRNLVVLPLVSPPFAVSFAIILAWLLTRPKLSGRGALDFSATVMQAIPGTVVGIGYIIAYNAAPYFWTGTFFIIIIAYVFRRLPVGLRTGIAAQKQIDPSLEEASLDLGASRLRTFTRVTFPLLSRAFLAGVICIFIRSMTDLSAAVFLNAGSTQLFTVTMFSVMKRDTASEAAAFAALLIVIILLSLGLLGKVTGKSFVDLFRI